MRIGSFSRRAGTAILAIGLAGLGLGRRKARLAAVAALVLALPSHAAVIYDNGAHDRSDGAEITRFIAADDFTVGSATTLTHVQFWTAERGPYHGSVTWSIYADEPVNNQPGTLLFRGNQTAVTRTEFGFIAFHGIGHLEVRNDFSVGEIDLLPGRYWLGLHNGPLTNDGSNQFWWQTTADNATVRSESDITPFDTGGWSSNDIELAFALFSAPEPGSVLLIGIALAGLGFRRQPKVIRLCAFRRNTRNASI